MTLRDNKCSGTQKYEVLPALPVFRDEAKIQVAAPNCGEVRRMTYHVISDRI